MSLRTEAKAGDESKLAPYRIEWRPNFVTNWILLRGAVMTHDEAMRLMDTEHKEHGGQVRVVTQHVIANTELR